jgi:hypothetical protein
MKTGIAITLLALMSSANAFESGSTGADGAFNPTADTQLTLPPSGIFNFTDVNIPAGVTLTFTKNANNTPVYILATGDVTIDGTINVNGGKGGNPGNGTPGVGGPGGFDGGQGGLRQSAGAPAYYGGNGAGPGAGQGGATGSSVHSIGYVNTGSGGGFGSTGSSGYGGVPGGVAYGTGNLRVLIGGSGGGGAAGYNNIAPGGGGGGGALLIASSGTVSHNGTITARGGTGGDYNNNSGSQPGAGSGGAIRIVATTIQGEGSITAAANGSNNSIAGGNGRIRLEAEEFLRSSGTSPAYKFAAPYPVFFADFPTLRISNIGGESVATNPSGYRDVVLPGVTTNPVTVSFETTNIPLGTTINLIANPERGSESTAISSAVSGSEALGTASAEISLPNGNATLFAHTTFTVQLALNDQANYIQYAQGEKVEKLRFDIDTDGQSETTFITLSGNEYTWPSNQVAFEFN